MVVALAITLVLTGFISWVNSEGKLTRRNLLLVKAQYGAEGVAEYALAQVRCILQQKGVFTNNLLASSGAVTLANGNVLGASNTSVLTGVTGSGSNGYATTIASSLVTLQNNATTASDRYTVTGTQLHIGNFTTESLVTFSSSNVLYEDDPLRGQQARVRRLKVIAGATATDTQANESLTAYCEEILEIRDTAIFGFMSFYNMDFEIASMTNMAVVGALHGNQDMYLGTTSGNQLSFDGVVTSAGDIFQGYPANVGSGMAALTGNISFENTSGTQVQMKEGSTWIDSNYSGWKDTALNKWGGNVQSKDHGILPAMPANVPTYVPDKTSTPAYDPMNDAHDLIEPSIQNTSGSFRGNDYEAAKFANQACLVLKLTTTLVGTNEAATVVQVPTLYKYTADASGTYVRPTATGTATYRRDLLTVPANLVKQNKMYDKRQNEYVHTADIDMSALRTAIEVSGVATSLSATATFTPNTEWNGIIYIEHDNPALGTGTMGAVRLYNGGTIPSWPTAANGQQKGTTIATNAPLYIMGHYNSNGSLPSTSADIKTPDSNEVPAAIAADAVTVLSAAWTRYTGALPSTAGTATDDAASNDGLSYLVASNTEIGAAIMTGIVPSNKQGTGNWSGAFNNIARFLEDWSGKTIGIRGSFSVLYESEVATASLPTPSNAIFSPPSRWFGLSTDFVDGDFPPGAPRARTYRRISSRQLSPAEYTAAVQNINTW